VSAPPALRAPGTTDRLARFAPIAFRGEQS
jgi:hypothetical protein